MAYVPAIPGDFEESAMRTYTGSTVYPLTEMIRDTVQTHGLRFAVQYYSRKLPAFQMRVLFRGALGV